MNNIKRFINYIINLNNKHKESTMLSYEAMSTHTNKYMGMGILAITHNKVDIITIIMGIVTLMCYLAYRHIMHMRTMRITKGNTTHMYLCALTRITKGMQ